MVESIGMDLIAALEKQRVKAGMTHKQFACHMGIGKSYWRALVNGNVPVGQKVTRMALLRYPWMFRGKLGQFGKEGEK